MIDGPSLKQRQALGNLFKVLSRYLPDDYKDYFWKNFEEWNLIRDSDISLYDYYYELKHLPSYPKRIIIYSALKSWNKHHDFFVLYQIINSLIYLKICGSSEYFFMQYIYNFMKYFSSICEDTRTIEIEQNMLKQNWFIIRFWKDSKYSDTHGIVELQISPIKEEQRIAIVPWFDIIEEKLGKINKDKDSIENIVESEFIPLLQDEFAKKHCPWIYSNLRFSYCKSQTEMGVVIILSSIEYVDSNGETD